MPPAAKRSAPVPCLHGPTDGRAVAMLRALCVQSKPNVITCLVTGNLEPIGWGKMQAIGLAHLFSTPKFGGQVYLRPSPLRPTCCLPHSMPPRAVRLQRLPWLQVWQRLLQREYRRDVARQGGDDPHCGQEGGRALPRWAEVRHVGLVVLACRKLAAKLDRQTQHGVVQRALCLLAVRAGDIREHYHIGDAPQDLYAAAAAGVNCIGVGTGVYSVAELEDLNTGAIVLGNLGNVEEVLQALGLGSDC